MPTTPTPLPLQPADVRPLLVNSLPWAPLDFLRGVSNEGDREVFFRGLLRDLAPVNDLRFIYPIAGNRDVAVCAERLPWDSSYFGYEVARLNGVFPLGTASYSSDADYTPALRALVDSARDRGIRYLFAVTDARDLATLRALTALSFVLIETRIYLYCPVREYRYPRRFRCRLATGADVDDLIEMAATVENPYDRFNSDPFIGRDVARQLIAQWIRASITEGFADETMIPDYPKPGSLITTKHHAGNADAWGRKVGQKMLALAAPRADNRWIGVVSETIYRLRDLGFDYVFFTTQLPNHRLLRTAEHVGYRLGRGEYVFRILL